MIINFQKHHTTHKRKRLKKSIREAIKLTLICVIGSIALAALFFSASFQEQDRLTIMAVEEVQDEYHP